MNFEDVIRERFSTRSFKDEKVNVYVNGKKVETNLKYKLSVNEADEKKLKKKS